MMTSNFCMDGARTLMRPQVSFHINIAPYFLIIEICAISKITKSVKFSKCSVHQILGSFLLLDFKNIDIM